MVALGPWPYGGKHTVVMTGRPLVPTPGRKAQFAPVEGGRSSGCGDRERRRLDLRRRGGGAIVPRGKAATPWNCVVPSDGDGIPLFGRGTPGAACASRRRNTANGLMQLDYEMLAEGRRRQSNRERLRCQHEQREG